MATIKELQDRIKKRQHIKNTLIDKKTYYLSKENNLPIVCLKKHSKKVGDRTAFVYGEEKRIAVLYPVIESIKGDFIKTIGDYSYFLYPQNKKHKKEFSKLLNILKDANLISN